MAQMAKKNNTRMTEAQSRSDKLNVPCVDGTCLTREQKRPLGSVKARIDTGLGQIARDKSSQVNKENEEPFIAILLKE